jgi:hypothetical protein
MKIIFFAYRDWGKKIFDAVETKEKYLITHNDYSVIDFIKPDNILAISSILFNKGLISVINSRSLDKIR